MNIWNEIIQNIWKAKKLIVWIYTLAIASYWANRNKKIVLDIEDDAPEKVAKP